MRTYLANVVVSGGKGCDTSDKETHPWLIVKIYAVAKFPEKFFY